MYVSLLKFVWCFFPATHAEARFPCKVPGDGSGISLSFLRKTTHHHAFLVPGFQSIRKNLYIYTIHILYIYCIYIYLESVCPLFCIASTLQKGWPFPIIWVPGMYRTSIHIYICSIPPPETNIAPELWCLEDNPFLLGFGICSGAVHC